MAKFWVSFALGMGTVALSACGGSDGGSGGLNSAADLSSPDKVGALVVAALNLSEGLDVIDAKSGKAIRSKTLQTTPCDEGSFELNDATGRYEFKNCLFEDSGEGYSFRSLMNGVTVDACQSGGWSENTDCGGKYRYELGENGQAFTAKVEASDGLDIALSALLTSEETETFSNGIETYLSVQNGRLSIADGEEFAGTVTVEFANFRVSEIYNSSTNRTTESFDGTVRTDAGNVLSDCNAGEVTFKTISPFVFDEAAQMTLSGELELTTSAGATATVKVQNDVVTITANGQSVSYTQDELDAFCH